MKEKYNVVIIGSGIAGMTAAIYLKRGGLDVLVIEEEVPGGQLNKIAEIDNYPGFVKTSGPELAMSVYEQVNELEIDYLFGKVLETKLDENEKKIITDSGVVNCDYVVIATGKQSKKLKENDDEYLGKGVSYCALCDGNLYKGQDVAVVGGGNSALEEMLYLSNICRSVTGILRSDNFRGEDYLVEQIKNKNNIKIMYHSNVIEYNIKNDRLTSVTLDNGNKIEVNGLFISIGSLPRSDLFAVEKDNGFIIVDDDGMTSVKNVYACGDVIKKKVYQLTTATGEGTLVAHSIIKEWKSNK